MTKQGQWSPSGVWRWREVKLVDSVRAHVFLRFSFVYARDTKRLSLSPRVSNTRTCEWHSATRARDQANDHNKINGVFSPLKSTSFPSINHKFTPVLIFTSSILCHFPLCASFDPAFPFYPLKPVLHLCALTFEQKLSGHHTKSIKILFSPHLLAKSSH